MFGYVMANGKELSKEEKRRYGSVYCGICRRIRMAAGRLARLGLSYDMAFLSLLLMSLYEPEEESGPNACGLHPVTGRPWVDNEFIRYGADMNLLLAYYNCMDDYADRGSSVAKWIAGVFAPALPELESRYPRQTAAAREALGELSRLEQENCPNPDLPAGVFGKLLGELFVYKEDRWQRDLRCCGEALGRFIYLADGAVDYRRDARQGNYNPYLAKGTSFDPARFEEDLVQALGRCAGYYEKLPLVQDKALMDNILYSGLWLQYRRKMGTGVSPEDTDGK